MCSIVGMAFQKGNKVRDNHMIHSIMRRLLMEGKSRGNISTGVCFSAMDRFTVLKKNLGAAAFLNTPEYDKAEAKYLYFDSGKGDARVFGEEARRYFRRPLAVLGHNRYPTKGEPTVNSNNHPITAGRVVGVHNGSIGNDDKLFNLYNKNFSRIGRVDSEIIFALIDYYARKALTGSGDVTRAIIKASSRLTGGYACAMVHTSHPYAVFLFRHGQPCVIRFYDDVGIIMWASLSHFMTSATQGHDLGAFEEWTLPNNSGVGLDIHSNKLHKFDLDVPTTHFQSF